MNANQSCGLHFGAGSGDYDCYQSSVPKKKENFWQKWKKWIIGGTVAVGGNVGVNINAKKVIAVDKEKYLKNLKENVEKKEKTKIRKMK